MNERNGYVIFSINTRLSSTSMTNIANETGVTIVCIHNNSPNKEQCQMRRLNRLFANFIYMIKQRNRPLLKSKDYSGFLARLVITTILFFSSSFGTTYV